MIVAVLVALFVVVIAGLAVLPISARWGWSVCERLGGAVLFGCGALGTVTLLVGVMPGGLKSVFFVAPLLFAWPAWRGLGEFRRLDIKAPSLDPIGKLVLGGCILLAAFALIGALSFPDTLEWDSLAYHLAVPKLWLQAGQIGYVQGIHHSNFPFVVECAEMWGLAAGSFAGAKFISWSLMVAGALSVWGLAQRWYGGRAGQLAGLAFLAAPVIAWEGGTAYIDHVHGVFAGLGVLYLSEWLRRREEASVWPGAVFLGLACASKYTGLQTFLIAGFVALLFLAVSKDKRLGQLLTAGAAALAIAAPWYVKTFVYTGNPVYPFFYEKLGGKDWNTWRASIYKDEQQSFGVGRTTTGRDPVQIGNAILGLAYQPGRYTNPNQANGGGSPTGALGAFAVMTLFLLAVRGPRDRGAKFVLATVGISLAAWFVLSQQSRYLATLVVIAAPFASVAIDQGVMRWFGRGVLALQAVVVLLVLYLIQTKDQLQVLLGVVPQATYQQRRIAFVEPANWLNGQSDVKKVALYDEVFGFLLDKPYFWANPGHSMKIPYETLTSGEGLADALKAQGFTHVYWDTKFQAPEAIERWSAASGLVPGDPYSNEEQTAMSRDLNLKWKVLLAEAVRGGRLKLVKTFGRRLVFEVE